MKTRSWAMVGAALGLAGFVGCSANDSANQTGTGGAGGVAAGAGVGGTAAGGGSIALDGGGATSGDGAAPECKKVDVLFVVDNSGSMADNQQSLVNSFPGFVAAMRQKLAFADSYHVAVVTSDDYSHNAVGCRKIGNLVTTTGGNASSASTCIPAGSPPYLDGADPNLATKFACIGKVGDTGSDDERVARALLNALTPTANTSGTCNLGFAREDSLLVIVIITDEDDVPDVCSDPSNPTPSTCQTYGSGGTPADWFDEVSADRSNHPENVVVLSLIGPGGNSCGAQINSKVLSFTHRFGDNGFVGDICSTSYDKFFVDALPVIDTACQKYVPVH